MRPRLTPRIRGRNNPNSRRRLIPRHPAAGSGRELRVADATRDNQAGAPLQRIPLSQAMLNAAADFSGKVSAGTAQRTTLGAMTRKL